MTTTLERLIAYPHRAVFDKDPQDSLYFRLTHTSGLATWKIAERVMTASNGTTTFTYALDVITVKTLMDQLVIDGFTLLDSGSAVPGYSAMVLIEGSGKQVESNGDHVRGFSSVLWAIFTGQSIELSVAAAAVLQALRQMIIGQAEGEWLDYWGGLLGVSRRSSEGDTTYAPWIVKEALRNRCNAHAIELAIRDETGWDVRIYEPWHDMFMLDDTVLSGGAAFYDGDTIGRNLIQPIIYYPVDEAIVLRIIERNRPVGVGVLAPKYISESLHTFLWEYPGLTWNSPGGGWTSTPWTTPLPTGEFVHGYHYNSWVSDPVRTWATGGWS